MGGETTQDGAAMEGRSRYEIPPGVCCRGDRGQCLVPSL